MNGPLIDINGRVLDRARQKRQRRVRLIARLLLALTVVGVLGWVATGSPLFSVKKVEVTGNNAVTVDAITRAAAVPLGVPLAQVDAAAIAGRLTAVAGIGRADVSVALPDKVAIKVTERSVAVVVTVPEGFAWIDPSGRRFNQTAERPAGVPLAQANPDDQSLLADVATVVGALPQTMVVKVAQVVAQTRDSIVVETTDKTRIIWGSADASTLKGQVTQTLLKAQPTCRSVDVSSPTHPTTKC